MTEKIRETELKAEALTDEELEAVNGGIVLLFAKLPEEENQDIRFQRKRNRLPVF